MIGGRNIDSACAHDGKVQTHHDMFPRWLYPVGYTLEDAENLDELASLLQGHYLINVHTAFRFCSQLIIQLCLHQVLRYIYVAGSKKPVNGRAVCLRVPGVTWLTPQMVGYACCQVCPCPIEYKKEPETESFQQAQFTISNQKWWDDMEHDFELEGFFWNIVDILTDMTAGQEKLSFLNK